MVLIGERRLAAAVLLAIFSSSTAAVTVSFIQSRPLREGAIGRICLRAEGESNQEIRVGVDTLDDSATAGEDYVLIDKYVVFGAFEGNQTRCVRASVSSDGVYEGEESFTVTMIPPESVEAEAQQLLVHITDSDVVTVGFRESSRSLEEGRSGEICFEAKGISEREFGVRIQTQIGTASAVDYVPVDQEVVVGRFSGLSSHCITVSTVEDNILENTETFFLFLATTSNSINVESTELPVTVLDNDIVSVGFEKPVFWNYEDDGEIIVRVVMAGRSDIPITVLFSTQNVHALANEDYLPQEDVPVTFQPGEKVKEFGVTILDDSLAEGDEGFTATLASKSKRIKIALSVAVLGIWRSDGGTNYK